MKAVITVIWAAFMTLILGCKEPGVGLSSVSLASSASDQSPSLGPQSKSDGVSEALQVDQVDAHAVGVLAQPMYPKSLRGRHIGLVEIPFRIVVGKDGSVIDVVRLSVAQNVTVPHYAEFEAAIRDAVKKWRFSPARILSSNVNPDTGVGVVNEQLVEMTFDYHFKFYESQKN